MNYEMKLTYFLLFQTTRWVRCCTVCRWPGQARVPTCSRCPGPARPPPPRRRPHPSPGPAARDRSCINFPPRGKSSSCWSMAWWPTVASDFKFITFDTYCHRLFLWSDRTEAWHYWIVGCVIWLWCWGLWLSYQGSRDRLQCGMRLTCHRQSSHSLIHDHTHIL